MNHAKVVTKMRVNQWEGEEWEELSEMVRRFLKGIYGRIKIQRRPQILLDR